MAVILEFYSLVIRRDRLEAALPGGWPQYLAEYGEPFEGWFDEDLLRTGAMNPMDFDFQIKHWRRRGLRLLGRRNGQEALTR